ncbi:MAG: hypothetical protein WAV07_10770 [Candidatus Contendobacter sp.]
MHRIERIEQHGLARRFSHPDGGLFIGRHQRATLRIAEFDQSGEDGQPRRVAGTDREVKLGAPDGGSRRHGLDFQRFAAVAHPDFAAQHAQDALHHLGGGGCETFRRRADLLEFQPAVGVELELGAVGQQDRGPATLAGPYRLAGRQRLARANRLPAPFAQDLGRSQNTDDLARLSRQGGAD